MLRLCPTRRSPLRRERDSREPVAAVADLELVPMVHLPPVRHVVLIPQLLQPPHLLPAPNRLISAPLRTDPQLSG